MFSDKEDFKFYVNEFDIFTLENLLISNKIEFHNEQNFGTNFRTTKYYIKNSDRVKFDELTKQIGLEIFIDSAPRIETRLSKFKLEYLFITFLIITVLITIPLILQ